MKTAKDYFQYILGILIVAAFFAVIIFLMYVTIPERNKDLLNILLGALIASFTTVKDYFFGSSKGSAEKTDLLSKKPGDTL
jgi:uncharacterized BrkB/YihY/UPF0761 family membrane protein